MRRSASRWLKGCLNDTQVRKGGHCRWAKEVHPVVLTDFRIDRIVTYAKTIGIVVVATLAASAAAVLAGVAIRVTRRRTILRARASTFDLPLQGRSAQSLDCAASGRSLR
jgi:hypothetical protein